MFKLKFVLIALLTTITLTSKAQAPSGWAAAHQKAHSQEQLANNKSRLDLTVIETQRNQEVMAREAGFEAPLSIEGKTLIDDILRESATHIGKKYVWASKGPNTFDCSGFTGYVYKQFGYKIGACSRDQYKTGKAIDLKNARKGDLIFFTSRSSGSNVGHVGIVWDVNKETGDIKFIHSSTKRGVIISDFEGYYVRRFVGIKRVIE